MMHQFNTQHPSSSSNHILKKDSSAPASGLRNSMSKKNSSETIYAAEDLFILNENASEKWPCRFCGVENENTTEICLVCHNRRVNGR